MPAFTIGNLSLLLAIPVIGVLLLAFVPRHRGATLFSIALVASGVNFVCSLITFSRFDAGTARCN